MIRRMHVLGVLGFGLLTTVASAGPATGLTLKGMIPRVGQPVVVIANYHFATAPSDSIRFLFSAPLFNAGVNYSVSFCVGPPPPANTCGAGSVYTQDVNSGQSVLAVVPAAAFKDNVLLVGQGTGVPVPYSVTIE